MFQYGEVELRGTKGTLYADEDGYRITGTKKGQFQTWDKMIEDQTLTSKNEKLAMAAVVTVQEPWSGISLIVSKAGKPRYALLKKVTGRQVLLIWPTLLYRSEHGLSGIPLKRRLSTMKLLISFFIMSIVNPGNYSF